jgi:cyclic pyranopterin phosphate synthase
MVDVGDKDVTTRRARARGRVFMSAEAIELVADQGLKKGDALQTARLAGIMAAKKTADLIPLCHPLGLDHVDVAVRADVQNRSVEIESEVGCRGRTGVEMEALTAVSVAALTVYDMVKAVDKTMTISDVTLMEKSGGRSGHYRRD